MKGVRAILADPVLRLAVLALFLYGAGIASVAPYQSLVALGRLGLSEQAYSVVLIAGSLSAVAGALGVGLIGDRLNRRRSVAMMSAAVWAAGAAAIWLSATPAAFVFGHVLLLPLGGTLFGQIFVLARLAAADHPLRDDIMAAVRAIFALPFILILPLWSIAVAGGVSLLAVYAFCAVTGLGALAAIALGWPRDDSLPPVTVRTDFGSAFRALVQGSVLARLVALSFAKCSVLLYMVLLGPLLTGEGRPEAQVALFAGLVAGFEIPVMLGVGPALRRLGRSRLILAGTLLHGGFLLGLPLLAAHPALWALTLPAALGAGVTLSLPISYVQEMMADRPGAGGALIAVNQFLAGVVMSGVFALGTALGGFGLTAVLGAAAVVAGGIAIMILDRPAPAPAPVTPPGG